MPTIVPEPQRKFVDDGTHLDDVDNAEDSKDTDDKNKKTDMPDQNYNNAGYTNQAYNGSTNALDNHEFDDRKQHFGVDENEERGNWSGRLDFLLSCLGYAVGLGNVWRFPYLCYKSGGGAFFIPYVIMLLFVGIPIFFCELYLGQFTSEGPLTCWKFAPMFSGLGWAMNVVSGLVGIYYNVIIAWSFYYLFASMAPRLPWQDCKPEWKAAGWYCEDDYPIRNCNETFDIRSENGTCVNNNTITGIWNRTAAQLFGFHRKSPSEIYFETSVDFKGYGIDNVGEPVWYLVLCLLLAWIVVYLCLIKGVKSSGKVVYFTALFPYAVLIILFIRGLLLEGGGIGQGVYFYLTPKWEKLLDSKVWFAAANQIFFSLSACWGGLIALSSYNRFHNNCFRDALIVSVGNCLTSFFAGFVVFFYIGHMAEKLGTDVENVAASGPGLVFVVYPRALTYLPLPQLWSILFFIMLITLGLDSQFTLLETVVTSLSDLSPNFMRKRKMLVLTGMCVVFFIIGLSMCTKGGVHVLTLIDHYAGGWNVLMIAIFELIAVGWVYGVKRVTNDVIIMIGFNPLMPIWGALWCVVSPLLVLFVLLFSWMDYSPAGAGGKDYPVWANAIGWCFALISVGGIFVWAIISFIRATGSFWERLRAISTPTVEWGPALVKHRRLVTYVQGFVIDPKGSTLGEKFNSSAAHTNPTFTKD